MANDAQFLRPNHARSVEVFGDFNDDLAAKLLSGVAALKSAGSKPITVYINSYGGGIRTLDIIEGILRCSDLDQNLTLFITVAVGNAASAGADLLTLGNYACAHEHSLIHFHGARYTDLPETLEDATQIANELQRINRSVSRKLAEAVIGRLMFRYQQLKPEFKKRRSKRINGELSDLESFLDIIETRVSLPTRRLLGNVRRHVKSASDLSRKILPRVLPRLKRDDTAVADWKVLRAVVQNRLGAHKSAKTWRLDERGINEIIGAYFLIRDYNLGEHWSLVHELLWIFGRDFLRPSELKRFRKIKDDDDKLAFLFTTVGARLTPLWYFAVSLCRFLMTGENRLTPTDAYYLGIVDEVIGTELKGRRIVVEQMLAEEEKKRQEKEKSAQKTSEVPKEPSVTS